MKNKNIIYMCMFIIIGISFTGLITAGIIKFPGLQRHILPIDDNRMNSIQSTGIDTIDIQKSPIVCGNNNCWSDVYQEGLIQTRWINSKSYCEEYPCEQYNCSVYNNKYDFCENYSNECKLYSNDCIQYIDYTQEELINIENDWIQNRINEYADSVQKQQDEQDSQVQLTGAGRIGN
jgi:hypothetical protein